MHPHERSRLFEDTPPDVEERLVALWREATPEQKLAKIVALGHGINELVRAEIRRRYPGATDREVELRLASRNLDRDTMVRAFGWDPDVHGR